MSTFVKAFIEVAIITVVASILARWLHPDEVTLYTALWLASYALGYSVYMKHETGAARRAER